MINSFAIVHSIKVKTRHWNTGIVEWWNDGFSREGQSTNHSQFLDANIPIFQNSIIPT
jgi:hypothetical protein